MRRVYGVIAATLLLGLTFVVALQVSAVPGGRQVDPNIGNCLSTPVIFSDGISIALRGTQDEELFEGAFLTIAEWRRRSNFNRPSKQQFDRLELTQLF
ncbi:MAG: hypothetical protein HUJ26_21890 [Planctomycetaceae bacterium]|nr:hypothetical protein [Planctomycetaceae bacterium]